MKYYVIEPTARIVVGYFGNEAERKRFALPGEIVTLTQKALSELEEGTYKVHARPKIAAKKKSYKKDKKTGKKVSKKK